MTGSLKINGFSSQIAPLKEKTYKIKELNSIFSSILQIDKLKIKNLFICFSKLGCCKLSTRGLTIEKRSFGTIIEIFENYHELKNILNEKKENDYLKFTEGEKEK